MHLIDRNVGFMGSTAIVGNTIPVAVGMALAIQNQLEDRISCVFFGDGSTEEGVFYEAANFAVLRNLPILFVCENNYFSVYSPLEVRQPHGRSISELASAIGLRAFNSYGNDVRGVAELAEEAIASIRSGSGPVFLELSTYRWREHCGPNFDDDLGYRNPDVTADWMAQDPLVLATQWQKPLSENLITSIEREIAVAFEFAEGGEFPTQSALETSTYA